MSGILLTGIHTSAWRPMPAGAGRFQFHDNIPGAGNSAKIETVFCAHKMSRLEWTRCATGGRRCMSRLDESTIAHMETALEKACRNLPNGGDHETRKFIAQKLKLSAKK